MQPPDALKVVVQQRLGHQRQEGLEEAAGGEERWSDPMQPCNLPLPRTASSGRGSKVEEQCTLHLHPEAAIPGSVGDKNRAKHRPRSRQIGETPAYFSHVQLHTPQGVPCLVPPYPPQLQRLLTLAMDFTQSRAASALSSPNR